MEKLKNLVNPGSKKDDEVMYGSGRSDDPVHTGLSSTGGTSATSGQGSHFGSSRTAGQEPLSTSSNPTGTSQYDTAAAGSASHGLREPYASRMPGGFDDDDAATTASVSSGIPGQSQSRSTMMGVNDPKLAEKPLPREPTSGTGTGTGYGQTSLTGNTYTDRSIENRPKHGDQSGSSHLGRDAALGAGVVGTSAHRHEEPQRDSHTTETDRSFPLGGNSAPHNYGSNTASSHLANKVDPRIDADRSGTAGSTGYGSTSTGYPSTDMNSTPGTQGSLGRDTLGAGAGTGAGAIGSSSTRGAGLGSESWQHEHQHHGHQYGGDPCESEAVGDRGGPHFVPGPHVTDTANRLDPRVGGSFGDTSNTDDSNLSRHHGHHGHRGEEAALAGSAGAAGLGAFERDHRKQGTTENTTSSEFDPSNIDRHVPNSTQGGAYDSNRGTTANVSSTGKTAGPHKSDMLNKLDPRVDSDLSKQQDIRGSNAALTGAGATGLYEAEKHSRGNESNLETGGQSTYGSGVDPRVNRSGMARDESAVSSAGSGHQHATTSTHHTKRDAGLVGASGIGAYEAEKHLGSSARSDSAVTPQDRLAGSGHQPAIAGSSSSYQPSSYSNMDPSQTGSHVGHGPQAAGAIGTGAFDGGDKASNMKNYSRTGPESQVQDRQHHDASSAAYSSPAYGTDSNKGHHASHHAGRDAALVGTAGAGAGALAGHEYSHRDTSNYGNESYQDISQGHHNDRDAAGIGARGTGAAPYDDTRHGHHVGKDSATTGAAGAGASALAGHAPSQRNATSYGAEPYQGTSDKHHTGRDAAMLGGAAGAGGLAEHEYSKHDAAKLQKEQAKEEKALEKQHSKDVKHHNKELAMEQKAHDKALDKSEKAHEKAMEKNEKKQEKAFEKEETKQEHDGKKHGGLLGFLHRDKPDKELKEDEARRQAATHPSRGQDEVAAGAGATGLESRSGYDPLEGEHGSQSGVHDRPIGIGSGLTTHDAYGTHDSGHNKLHKDPPSKVVESRGYEFQ